MTKKITNILLKLIFITFSFYCFCLAQTDTITSKLNGYDKFVESLMKEWEIPGAAIAVVKDGHIVYAKGFGYRDLNNKLKVNTKTIFGIGSITKSFVAGSIGILQDEKRVHIDTPIIRYIPDFKLYDECMTKNMTIRDMLSHRSGLSGSYWLYFPKDRKEMTYALRYEKPTKEFRDSYQYNSYNYVVLCYVLEKITGVRWEDYLKEKIFRPLEMEQSCFTYRKAKLNKDCSIPYLLTDEGAKKHDIQDDSIWGPAGQMFSNVEEMSNWMIMYLNNGVFQQKRIISENYIKEMIKPNISHSLNNRFDDVFAEYGLGFQLTSYQGNLIAYHVGANEGFISHMIAHPESKTGIIVLTNLDDARIVSCLSFRMLEQILGLDKIDWKSRIHEIVKYRKEMEAKAKMENQKNKQPDAHPTLPSSKYIGKYSNDLYGVLEIISKGDTLKALYHGLTSLLTLYQNDVFITDGTLRSVKMSFAINNNDIDKLQVDFNPEIPRILFEKITK